MPTHLAESHRAKQGLPDQPALTLKRRPTLPFLAERFGPLVLGIAAGICTTRLSGLWLLDASWRGFFLDKMLDVEIGSVAGLLAIVAFLPALEEKTIIRKLKQWGYYRYIVGYLREAIWTAGLAILLSLASITFPDAWKMNDRFNLIFSTLWWAVAVYSVACDFRIIKLALKSLVAN